MGFGKKQILVAFLEKDNIKLLAYDVSGKSVARIFGGQVTFGEDTLRDAFISDPVKFSSQVKMVLSQKPPLSEIPEGILFIHPDKTFIKAMPQAESVDAFVRSLPFFKEELVIQEPAVVQGSGGQNLQVNYVAFEKKLVEDFERPFLESGKKIQSVNAAVPVLARKYVQSGKYILVLPFEKDVTAVVCQDGVILDMGTFPKDVWVGRVNEFRLGKGFSDVVNVFVVGNLEPGVADKMRTEQQLNVTELGGGDVYDQAVGAVMGGGTASSVPAAAASGGGPKFSMPKIPGQKYIFLVGAAIIGFILVFLILKNVVGVHFPGLGGSNQSAASPTPEASENTPKPSPTPEAKPEDFKVIVLNGTKVTGQAGVTADELSAMGFDVIETGNATTSGFVATRLLTVPEVPENIISQIENKLLETYQSVNREPLSSSSAQIEVIIGEKK